MALLRKTLTSDSLGRCFFQWMPRLRITLPSECFARLHISIWRCARSNLFSRRPNQKQFLVSTFQTRLDLRPAWTRTVLPFPPGRRWDSVSSRFGTVTAKAQPGNPKPRIFRLPAQQALINRLGFNNDGADVIADRLRELRNCGRWPAVPVGINIGKSRATPLEQATDDYLYSFRLLREFADYITLNVSSPNTPGLRELQEPQKLSDLLQTIGKEAGATPKPVVVKISPDILPTDLKAILAVCEEHQVAGIIATNTTLDHSLIPPQTRSGRRLKWSATARTGHRIRP